MLDSAFSQGPIFLACLVFMLGLVVVVHELGHYLAGRAFGAAAESFSVGFGRSIVEITDRRNTRWRVNWIPLGGFVKFAGEHQTAGDIGHIEAAPVGRPFGDLSVGQRSLVLLAGPAANFVLAIVIFSLLAFVNGRSLETVSVGAVNPGPAAEAGFAAGDRFVSVNGTPITDSATVRRIISLSTGDTLDVIVEREGQEISIAVTPVRMMMDNGLGQKHAVGALNIGLSVERTGRQDYGPLAAVSRGVLQTGEVIGTTGRMLGRMVTGREPLDQLSGPVGIGDLSRRVVTASLKADHVPLSTRLYVIFLNMVQVCAYVSVGIGLFNLLPLPVLDGGHLVFNAYEAVAGRALPARVQEISLSFGLALLLGMAVIVTWGDIVETGILGSFGA